MTGSMHVGVSFRQYSADIQVGQRIWYQAQSGSQQARRTILETCIVPSMEQLEPQMNWNLARWEMFRIDYQCLVVPFPPQVPPAKHRARHRQQAAPPTQT